MMTVAEMNAAKDFANELRSDVLAIELHLPSLGRRRQMSERHRCEVADHFGAKRRSVGATKGLYAPNQQEVKNIASVIGDVRRTWIEMTIAYRKGVRLLRRERLEDWIAAFTKHQEALTKVLAEADAHYQDIIAASREYLGEALFDINDYPTRFGGWVDISWGVHNFEPSADLQKLAPETYAREQQRVRKQFELAIMGYEQEAREQLQKLVGALLEKLTDAQAGKKVLFKEAATTNLREFFDRFDALGIRSDESLNELVDSAKAALGNATMAGLKKNDSKRDAISAKFDAVARQLDKLIAEAPVRSFDMDELD